MLYKGPFGDSLTSEEFTRACVAARVEVTIQAYPNPGDIYHASRILTIKSFNNKTIRIYQRNAKHSEYLLPPRMERKIMLLAMEEFPIFKEEPEQGTQQCQTISSGSQPT
jgi:hypothetical protein